MSKIYIFEREVWVYEGDSPWHFVTLPVDIAEEIRAVVSDGLPQGFGSVRVKVKVSQTSWQTSLFPDKQSKSYLLPLKKEVRKQLGLGAGDSVKVSLEL